MNCALMIGRKGSKGFPNKNIKKVFGKSICEYPIIAAKKSTLIRLKRLCQLIAKI